MVTKTGVFERRQNKWSDDSPTTDTRIIDGFIASNPNNKIITVFHSGVKHLVIVYEQTNTDYSKPKEEGNTLSPL